MARLVAGGLLVALGAAAAFAVVGNAGADPPLYQSVTLYRTVVRTETVHTRVEGHGIRWWRARAVHNRRLVNGQRITLRGIRQRMREQARDFRDGFGIRAVSPFLCIHGYEGSWTDPGAPYYGGLQMDWSFMSTYGGPFLRAYGTADHWPPFIQLAVAETARLSGRGYGPWPNTARMCGLL